MPDKDAFSDLRIAKEEEFFHSREQALLEKVKQRAAAQSEARRLGLRRSLPLGVALEVSWYLRVASITYLLAIRLVCDQLLFALYP